MPRQPPYHSPSRPGATPVHRAKRKVNRSERTYGLNSATWRALRAAILREEPLCRACLARAPARAVPAVQIDHINEDPNDNRPENLQPLCTSCHSRKTLAAGKGWAKGWSQTALQALDALFPSSSPVDKD